MLIVNFVIICERGRDRSVECADMVCRNFGKQDEFAQSLHEDITKPNDEVYRKQQMYKVSIVQSHGVKPNPGITMGLSSMMRGRDFTEPCGGQTIAIMDPIQTCNAYSYEYRTVERMLDEWATAQNMMRVVSVEH
jgi:hypothetical protein